LLERFGQAFINLEHSLVIANIRLLLRFAGSLFQRFVLGLQRLYLAEDPLVFRLCRRMSFGKAAERGLSRLRLASLSGQLAS